MSTQFTNRQWRLPNEENKSKVSNYSMDFDATSSISLGTPSSGIGVFNKQVFSFSVWVKRERQNVNETILNLFASSSNRGVELKFQYYAADGNYLCLQIGDVTNDSWYNNRVTNINSIMSLNVWYNITCTWDGTDSNIYINNVLRKNWTKNLTISYITSNQPAIGVAPNTSSKYLGEIDSFSYFDYVLSSSQVTTLYGSSSTGIGNPMSLSPKPVASYNLGDKSAFNGANYLVPNIAAEEADGDIAASYSPYALDFDSASSDYIDCGQNTNLDTGDLSVSIWINKDSTGSGTQYIFNNNNGSSIAGFAILMNSINRVFLYRNTGTYSAITGYTDVGFTTDTWHHLCFTYNDTTKSFVAYFNGVSFHTSTATSSSGSVSQNIIIGTNSGLSGNNFDGKLSNASIWDTDLTPAQVTEIYSEGVPQNLNNHSAYSNLVSWWQLGSNSSFNSSLNQWTCIDEKGTNTGESSQTFNEDAIVDGVGSYANGVSSGMGGDEVIGSAPFSDANSLSINMDVLDRVEDTPS